MVVGDSKQRTKVTPMTDADEKQEYITLILEGVNKTEAKKRARSANNQVNSRRVSGPWGGGKRPYISDMEGDDWLSLNSFTQDQRTDQEKEEGVIQKETIIKLLDHCTPMQRNALVVLYGLNTGTPLSYKEAAKKLGITPIALSSRRTKAIAKIVKAVNTVETLDTTKQKTLARKEYNRIWMANKRKQQKLETEVNNEHS